MYSYSRVPAGFLHAAILNPAKIPSMLLDFLHALLLATILCPLARPLLIKDSLKRLSQCNYQHFSSNPM